MRNSSFLLFVAAVLAATGIGAGIIRAHDNVPPQHPEAPPINKVCVVVPPGWDASYGPIDEETGIPETEPNLSLYDRADGILTLEHLISLAESAMTDMQAPVFQPELELIIPTVEQATEFVETLEDENGLIGYTVDEVFAPPGDYIANAAVWIAETETWIGVTEDCEFTAVEPQPLTAPPTDDRDERIAQMATLGIERGAFIGLTLPAT